MKSKSKQEGQIFQKKQKKNSHKNNFTKIAEFKFKIINMKMKCSDQV